MYNVQVFDWANLGVSDVPLGWRTGYYNSTTGEFLSSYYYICTPRLSEYSPNANVTSIVFSVPSGYGGRVYEYDNLGNFVGYYGNATVDNVTDRVSIEIKNGYKYKFAIGRFANKTAENYINSEFISQIFLEERIKTDKTLSMSGVAADAKITGDKIQELSDIMYTKQVNIPFKTNTSYRTGWRLGYFTGNVGEPYESITSNAYIRAHFALNDNNYPNVFNDLIKISITPPTGYTCRIVEVKSENGEIIRKVGEINSSEHPSAIDKTQTIDIDHNNRYLFELGRFNDYDAENYLTDSFISQIKLVGMVNETGKKRKTGTYEFFNVNVDRPLSFGNEDTITETQSIECVLRLPDTYLSSGVPTRLVLACHGASGYIDSTNNTWYNTSWKSFMDDLLAAGYAVFDANILPTNTGTAQMGYALGSPLYINVLKKAYDYIIENYNVHREIFAHGTSMGGVGASAFSNSYPDIVLAESSFAGRDITYYLNSLYNNNIEAERFAISFGYESLSELALDKFSHVEGFYPSLSLLKYNNGVVSFPPDRETDYTNWLYYFGEVNSHSQNDAIGEYTAKRTVPYKTWDSWADDVSCTKGKLILQKAFTNGNSSPYYCVIYDNATHTELSYGKINNMRDQLIAWYKRWE